MTKRRKALALLLFVQLLFLLYLKFVYVPPFTAEVYELPVLPDPVGVYAPNTALNKARTIDGLIVEDFTLRQNSIVGSTMDGRIVEITMESNSLGQQSPKVKTLTKISGTPLGIKEFQGKLYVCDAELGLLEVSADGNVRVLLGSKTSTGDPESPNFADGLVISKEGVIYFTDASRVYKQPEYVLDVLRSAPLGRIYEYDLRTGKHRVLLEDLFFPNGIELSEDEKTLIFCQTTRFRVSKYNIGTGQVSIFAAGLPGYPDNLWKDREGCFWVGLTSVRMAHIDLLTQLPRIREFIGVLPPSMLPKEKPYGYIIKLSPSGQVVLTLQDSHGRISTTTGAKALGKTLWISSLKSPVSFLDYWEQKHHNSKHGERSQL